MKNPLLFVVFNRPIQTQIVFDVIRLARPSRLYIACDGPRKNYPSDKELSIQTRKIVENIDWPCKVFYLYHTKNLGCKIAVASAINWFFEKEKQGVILEDDILPSLEFFKFCDVMLNKYQKNPRVGMISGFNPINQDKSAEASYLFSNHISIWGWAGWRRSWDNYQISFSSRDFKNLKAILNKIPSSNFIYYLYWKRLLGLINQGKIQAWSYQLNLMFFKKNYLTVIPNISLTQNIGFDGANSTNNSGIKPKYIKKHSSNQSIFPLTHPKNISANIQFDKKFINVVHNIKLLPLGLINTFLPKNIKKKIIMWLQ